ncbi:MAG: DUF1674 domain-containing protein [Pseudomonadota bacterium]
MPEKDPKASSPKTSGTSSDADPEATPESTDQKTAVEIGGRDGPEPTRFGGWEKGGRCIDF